MVVKETFDYSFLLEKLPRLLSALPLTLFIAFISLLLGWSLGLLIAYGKIAGGLALKRALIKLTDIVRGIPTVVLLYIVYFGMSVFLLNAFGIRINDIQKYIYIVVALMIEISASSSELFKSAFYSIPRGQLEAAHALGFTGIQTFSKVIVPQGVRVILPNIGNAILATIQSTALLYTLGIYDVLGRARQIDTNVSHTKTFELFLAAALIYWALGLISSWIFKSAEKKYSRGIKSAA